VYTTVTIPVDTEDPDVEAIEIAAALAGRLGAGVEMVSVASPRGKSATTDELASLSVAVTVPVSMRVLVSKDVVGNCSERSSITRRRSGACPPTPDGRRSKHWSGASAKTWPATAAARWCSLESERFDGLVTAGSFS
jgi:hypothetical protein